ncbi:retrovirus-related pol polyprotein from transposon TNT 1-94 [Tanacetum coccineum]|uniref:Retrovirus-related pol polyprotein from transposon TNT 1-94 n=1 Tax=Tanacetum coccineum TaxID=301880 RepID=A0ABQ5F535_9ASTR
MFNTLIANAGLEEIPAREDSYRIIARFLLRESNPVYGPSRLDYPLSIKQTELEGACPKEEVKNAVWDCGSPEQNLPGAGMDSATEASNERAFKTMMVSSVVLKQQFSLKGGRTICIRFTVLACSLYRNASKQAASLIVLLLLERLIHIESRKSLTVLLFDVDTRRISIRHYEILKSITLIVLTQNEPDVKASIAKRAVRNHNPLALVANSYANSLSSSRSSQQYYFTHPPSKSSYVQDGRVEIQGKSSGYVGGNRRNAGNQGRNDVNQGTAAGNDICYNYNKRGHYATDCLKPRVQDAKYFREQMLLATKDEAGVHLDDEENDFVFTIAIGDDQLEELNASVIMMDHLQPIDNDFDAEPKYDSDFVSEVNDSQMKMINGLFENNDHKQRQHAKLATIKPTYVDDQIDSNIIFDDPYVEDNSGQTEHAHDLHDQKLTDIESLIQNVQIEAKK